MDQQKKLSRVLALLQEAALDESFWPAASAAMDEALGAIGNALVVGEGPEDDIRIVFGETLYRGQRHLDVERDYLENYHFRDERVPRVRRLPDGKVTHVTKLYSAEELKTSPTFNEFSVRAGSRNGLNVRIGLAPRMHLTWGIHDPVQAFGWGSAQLYLIGRLVPQLRHFVLSRQALASADALGSSLVDLLGNSRIGIIHLDRRGRILTANDRASAILRQGRGLRDKDGFLHAWLPADGARLKRLVAQALPEQGRPSFSGLMLIRRPFGLPGLVLHVNPATVRQMDFGASSVGALVLLVDPEIQPRLESRSVAATLNLTPAQSQIAVLLSRGQTVGDIAAETGRRESTIRSHLKAIHLRLGISRRSDLVRLVRAVFVPSASSR